MPSAGLTPPTPSGVSTPSRHAQLTPLSAIAPTTPRPGPPPHLTCGGIDHADPLQHHHPHHAHLPRHPRGTPPQPPGPPTNTHPGRYRHGPHHRPLQAPTPCATRTPPPGATGADLSALQPTPRSAHARTADKPPAALTRTHSHTAASTSTTSNASQPPRPSPPAPATTTTKHQHKKTRARTTATRTAHNALTSTNTKHHDDEITTATKTNPRNPRGHPPPHASRPHASYAGRMRAGLRTQTETLISVCGHGNPRNHAEISVLMCCSTRVRNGLILPLPWVLSLA